MYFRKYVCKECLNSDLRACEKRIGTVQIIIQLLASALIICISVMGFIIVTFKIVKYCGGLSKKPAAVNDHKLYVFIQPGTKPAGDKAATQLEFI